MEYIYIYIYDRGYIGVIFGVMEKKMETTIYCRGYIGIILGVMEQKMETTIVGYIGFGA